MIRLTRSSAKAKALALLGAAAIVGCASGGVDGAAPSPAGGGTSSGGGAAATTGGSSALGGNSGASTVVASDPGRVTMHRLNLAEYDNTMRDLLGTKVRASADFKFPVDDRGSDFDNTADVLTVSPLHLASYNTAAIALVSAAMAAPAQRSLLVACDLAAGGASCARTGLEGFVPRAWRRAVTPAEVDNLMALVTLATSKGDSVETGFQLAVRAALLSPNFIYRPEIDPMPSSLTPHAVSDYELASRVSYFLWSSMPDDALLAAAKAGNLHEATTLASQVKRMLADPKAQALVDNFAGQWMYIRLIDEATPNTQLFPQFDAGLRSAFKAESQLLFREVAFNGLPADQLLTAKFTFANDRLAKFYGLPPVGSDQPKRVDLSNSPDRRGFLAHGGLLTVNSHSDRTSPVRRGKYVLTQMLCTEIPPPPPTVNTTLEPDSTGQKTLRQVLEAHVTNPLCATCHSRMDPIGFGMEGYDAIGSARTMDGTLPVDTTGTLPTGEQFKGLLELSEIIGKNPAFSQCLATKLYTYALGRGLVLGDPKHLDPVTVKSIATEFSKNGLQFQDLVAGVITSPTFLNRRGEGG